MIKEVVKSKEERDRITKIATDEHNQLVKLSKNFIVTRILNGPIKETKMLNLLSKNFRLTELSLIEKEWFEINFQSGKFEWNILKKDGKYIVLTEEDDCIYIYFYDGENDPLERKCLCVKLKMVDLIKNKKAQLSINKLIRE